MDYVESLSSQEHESPVRLILNKQPWGQTVLTIQPSNVLFIVDLVPNNVFPYLGGGFSLGIDVAVKKRKETITLVVIDPIKTVIGMLQKYPKQSKISISLITQMSALWTKKYY